MSRTYKYPREFSDDSTSKVEYDVDSRIKKRLAKQKLRKKMRIKRERSFKSLISFRDKQRASRS